MMKWKLLWSENSFTVILDHLTRGCFFYFFVMKLSSFCRNLRFWLKSAFCSRPARTVCSARTSPSCAGTTACPHWTRRRGKHAPGAHWTEFICWKMPVVNSADLHQLQTVQWNRSTGRAEPTRPHSDSHHHTVSRVRTGSHTHWPISIGGTHIFNLLYMSQGVLKQL